MMNPAAEKLPFALATSDILVPAYPFWIKIGRNMNYVGNIDNKFPMMSFKAQNSPGGCKINNRNPRQSDKKNPIYYARKYKSKLVGQFCL